VLRAVAESRVRWAFWPPDMDVSSMEGEPGDGIWISVANGDDNTEYESEEDESEPSAHSEETSESEEKNDSEEEGVKVHVAGVGRFGTLSLDDEAREDGDEEAEECT